MILRLHVGFRRGVTVFFGGGMWQPTNITDGVRYEVTHVVDNPFLRPYFYGWGLGQLRV